MIEKPRQASLLPKASQKRPQGLPLHFFASLIFLPVSSVLVHPTVAVVSVSHIAARAQPLECIFRFLILSARASF